MRLSGERGTLTVSSFVQQSPQNEAIEAILKTFENVHYDKYNSSDDFVGKWPIKEQIDWLCTTLTERDAMWEGRVREAYDAGLADAYKVATKVVREVVKRQ